MSYPVFVSYAHDDGSHFAKQIGDELFAKGIDAWVDHFIQEGNAWRPQIEQVIKECKIMVLIVTPIACSSIEVDKEYQLAKSESKLIIPFYFISPQSVDFNIPLEWKALQGIEFTTPSEKSKQYINIILNFLHGKSKPKYFTGEQSSDYTNLDRGRGLYRQGEYEQAKEEFMQATLATESLVAIAWYNLGRTLYELKDYVEAEVAYKRSLEFDPNSSYTLYNKGLAIAMQSRYQEALAAFEEALQKNSTHALTWYAKGIALERLDRYEDALKACEQALSLAPTISYIKHEIVQLKHIISEEKIKKTQKAFVTLVKQDKSIADKEYAVRMH